MYRLSVPVMNHIVTSDTREEYLRQFRLCGVDRVLLAVDRCFDPQEGERIVSALKDNISFFRENGIQPAVWTNGFIGHGGPMLPKGQEVCKTTGFTLLTTLTGRPIQNTYCPLDPNFQAAACRWLAQLATAGADLIFIDDDFRLSQHGEGICCACRLHQKRIGALLGRTVTQKSLEERTFFGGPNSYRSAWLKAQGDSLREMARKLRGAVDQVNPGVCVAYCSPYSTWDVDGTTAMELTKILAGQNPPVLRLHGAPYWVKYMDTLLVAVLEVARMLVSFCKPGEAELLSEGDVCPRPRYNIPASYLELYDGVLRADGGYNGILKYMFDYTASPSYEQGYMNRHLRDLPALKEIEGMFKGKKKAAVRVYCAPNQLERAQLPIDHFDLQQVLPTSPYPIAGLMLARCSLPTQYGGEGLCGAAFGENARRLTVRQQESGLILDATAAQLLQAQGVDVGLGQIESFSWSQAETETFLRLQESVYLYRCTGRFLKTRPDPRAQIESLALLEGQEWPLSYRYENAAGQRFLVFTFDGLGLPHDSGLLFGYCRQRQLEHGIRWLSRQPLPAFCPGNPDLYLMCAKEGDALAVGLFNCFADSVLNPEIHLDAAYSSVRFVNCTGRLEKNKVILDGELPAFGFAALELTL